jgi:protein arginine N-methyltransferase 1
MTVFSDFFGSYRDATVHSMMLHDVVRTEAYERALIATVANGCTVLDFGCGTGVLSIFASRAGADKVYAVDESIFIQKAYDIAKCNQIKNIDFYHNDHKELVLDTKVDILVSEWMGHFLFYEAMLGPLLKIRDKYLKEGGLMIPGRVSLHAGLVTDDYYYEDSSFLQRSPYGIDFSPICDVPLCQTPLENVTPNQILDTTVELGSFDLHTLKEPPKELKGVVVPQERATIYGFCGWFSAQLVEGINLSTGPNDPPTHWNQMYFPFDKPLELEPGVELSLHITLPEEDSKYEAAWFWGATHGKRVIKMNDIDHRGKLNSFLPCGLVVDQKKL